MARAWTWQRSPAAVLVVPCAGGTAATAAIALPPQPLVTVPILAVGAFALVVATARLVKASRVEAAQPRELEPFLAAFGAGDRALAAVRGSAVRGPVGELLGVAVHHLGEPAERLEARLAEQRAWLLGPLRRGATAVAWWATVAPALGLLGTLFVFARSLAFTVFDVGDPTALAASRASAFVGFDYGIAAGLPAWLVYFRLTWRVRRVADALAAAADACARAMPRSAP